MNRPHLDFVLALHRALPEAVNAVWSPYSVASALGLAAAGARGRTRAELAQALAPGGDLAALGRMLVASAEIGDAEVAVANTLWTRLGLELRSAYLRDVEGWPGGAARSADFTRAPETARELINEDVARTTQGLIRGLLAAGAVVPDTAALIVNALFLRVAWRHAFTAAATQPAPFHTPAGPRPVPTMRQRERLGYAAVSGWRMATLPTAGDIVVDLLLPDRPEEVVPHRETLTALYGASRSTLIDLHLPRFRIEFHATLNDALARLGVVAAFTREADFSAVTSTEAIKVDRVVHKAVLRVDEQGFEGAAATAVVMRTVSFEAQPPVPFHLDRPFLVVVRHGRTGAIFFLGRVLQPA